MPALFTSTSTEPNAATLRYHFTQHLGEIRINVGKEMPGLIAFRHFYGYFPPFFSTPLKRMLYPFAAKALVIPYFIPLVLPVINTVLTLIRNNC